MRRLNFSHLKLGLYRGGGNDPNLLWAKTDDDLIKEMLLKITK